MTAAKRPAAPARCQVIPGTRPAAETKRVLEDVLTQIRDEIDERQREREAAAVQSTG